MGQYTSYYLYQKYEQREGQDPIPCTPNIYSVDGQGTMQKVIKLDDDPECGYTPEPTEPIYRWYQMPISEGYVCDECPELQYRWVESGTTCVGYDKWNRSIEQYSEDGGTTWNNTNPPVYSATSLIEVDSTDCGVSYRWIDLNPSTDYYCSGTTKYYKQQKQKSYDGSTWENVTPAEYQWGGTAETESTDCGYVPPVTAFKFKATYTGGTSYSASCDGNTTLSSGDTRPSGYYTSEMTYAEIGSCIISIGEKAFQSYRRLSGITIPNSVTNIGYAAFSSCSGLTSIDIPNSVTSIGNSAFSSCNGLRNVNIPSSVTSLGAGLFQKSSGLTSVSLPSNAQFPDTTAGLFLGCISLTGVTMPNTVTKYETGTFSGCTSLSSFTIPSNVTEIGGQVFNGCSSLENIVIPSNVRSVGEGGWCFYECSNLKTVDISENCSLIGYACFRYCTSLTSIIVRATTPPTLGDYAFHNTNNAPIYVPAASLDVYKAANKWSSYTSRLQALP